MTHDESGRDAEDSVAGGTDAMTEARGVVEPDLLWIESVTERLLGTAGRPAAWERVYFEGRDSPGAPPVDEPQPGAAHEQPPAGDQSPAGPERDPLPQRAKRDFDGPVSYRQPAGYVPPPAVDPRTDPPPAADPDATSEDPDVSQPDPDYEEPPLSAEPSPVDLAPPEPHLEEVPAGPPPPPPPAAAGEPSAAPEPAEAFRPEEMPPAVLRAALRHALPDVVGLSTSRGPADAFFGDPRWSLPAEEPGDAADDAAEEGAGKKAPELTDDDADRLRAASAAELGAEQDEQPHAEEPVQSPYFDPPALDRPRAAASYADLGYGFPRPADQLTVSDVALRLAFRSDDRELAEAVVRLVARQARERSRLATAETYLDAILDEGDAALPGAARLRHILAD